MNAAKTLWVEALRSGDYQQGKHRLKDGDKYCCLGVACDVYQKHVGDLEIMERTDGVRVYDGLSSILTDKVAKWLDISQHGNLKEPIRHTDSFKYEALTALNDVAGFTFEQIANVIESGKLKGRNESL